MRFARAILLAALCGASAMAQTRLLVTAVESRTGKAVTDLKAADFTVTDDKTPLAVDAAVHAPAPIDVMLLVDTSLAGGLVQPVVFNLIDQLQGKEQMAIVSFADSAELVQDFTALQPLLRRSIAKVKYGNEPQVLDALYAAIDGGFANSAYRRVILLLTSGLEGYSRVREQEVIRLARRNGVSIYPVFAMGDAKYLFEALARKTGGAAFSLRNLHRESKDPPGARIFEVLRAHYTLTLRGKAVPSDRMKVEVQRPEKLFVSVLPLE